jgi:hypothetical protein
VPKQDFDHLYEKPQGFAPSWKSLRFFVQVIRASSMGLSAFVRKICRPSEILPITSSMPKTGAGSRF